MQDEIERLNKENERLNKMTYEDKIRFFSELNIDDAYEYLNLPELQNATRELLQK